LGFLEEVWGSRLAHPQLKRWTADSPCRLLEKARNTADTAPTALCCYGLLRADSEQGWLRFVGGRPVSQVTIDFPERVCGRLAQDDKQGLALGLDNAAWPISQKVRDWIRAHNARVKREGESASSRAFCRVKVRGSLASSRMGGMGDARLSNLLVP
jgi:hypothetical protein